MGGPVEVSGDQLRTIVERIEHVEQEISELNEGKGEIYQESQEQWLRSKSPSRNRSDQKEREEHESLLEVYLRAINGARVSKAA